MSLDDGETWKATNLSDSADESSFEVSTPLQDPGVPVGEGIVDDACVVVVSEEDKGLATNGVTYSGAGTTTCETMRDGATSQDDTHMCTTAYAAGDSEQSRNVSQLKSMANTILDPRYTPTIASMPAEGDLDWGLFESIDPTDIRNPSRNFVVYEDGDSMFRRVWYIALKSKPGRCLVLPVALKENA